MNSPLIWGPKLWFVMEHFALHFPNCPTIKDQQYYKQFYESLQYVLPCPNCKEHYQHVLNLVPIDNYLLNSKSLYSWLIKIKEHINNTDYTTKECYENHLRDI